MDALERAALQEQRRNRRRWKRLNIPSFIEKVRAYKDSAKQRSDAAQLEKNLIKSARIQDDLSRRLNLHDEPSNDGDDKIPPMSYSYSDQVLLNILFFETPMYDASTTEAQLQEIIEDLRRWSYTPFLSGCDSADVIYSRFWQLAQEYGIEYGPYDEGITASVMDYYQRTKHLQRPLKVEVVSTRIRHEDCDPTLCSSSLPCDLCSELTVSVPELGFEDTEEDIFLDCVSSLEDQHEVEFTESSLKFEPCQALILHGHKLEKLDTTGHQMPHISDLLFPLVRKAIVDAPTGLTLQNIELHLMLCYSKYATRHRCAAARVFLAIARSDISRRPGGLWKDHPPPSSHSSAP